MLFTRRPSPGCKCGPLSFLRLFTGKGESTKDLFLIYDGLLLTALSGLFALKHGASGARGSAKRGLECQNSQQMPPKASL